MNRSFICLFLWKDLRGSLRMSTTMSSIHFDEKELKDLDRVFNEIKSKSQSGRIMKDTLRSVFPPGRLEVWLCKRFIWEFSLGIGCFWRIFMDCLQKCLTFCWIVFSSPSTTTWMGTLIRRSLFAGFLHSAKGLRVGLRRECFFFGNEFIFCVT